MKNNIELELRGEIKKSDLPKTIRKLESIGKLKSKTKRLSVLFLGSLDSSNIDIRVRINKAGNSEVVFKKGDFHSQNRIEISQPINKDQFIGMVNLLSLLNFKMKVMERETSNYELRDKITASVVKASNIAYIEIEKMTNSKNETLDYKILEKYIHKLEIPIIKTKEEFDSLCERLTKESDWVFTQSKENISKVKKLLRKY